MEDFEKVYNFENLYEAHRLARRCKRDRTEIIDYELNLSSNLCRLQNELKNQTFKISGYNKFKIYDPKEREIQALCYNDRVMQHSLCDNVLKPIFEKKLIYDNSACRENKGPHFAINRLTKFFRDYYKTYKTADGYILKCDVKKFFPSINHEILKRKLNKIIKDKKVLNLLYQIIDSFNLNTGKGLPMGNQTSQWFALYYLDSVDRLIKEKLKIKYYTRYMDDFVLIHNSKNYLRYCKDKIEDVLNKQLKLDFNDKTQIFPIRNGVDYLGFHFYLTDTGKVIRKLRNSSKKRFKRRLKTLQRDYKNGSKSLEDIKMSLSSYKGHLKHGHTYMLKKKIYNNFVLKK